MWFLFREDNRRWSNIRISMEKEKNEWHQGFLSKKKKRRKRVTSRFPFTEEKRKMKKSKQDFDS